MDPQSAKTDVVDRDAGVAPLSARTVGVWPEERAREIVGEYLTVRFSEKMVEPVPLVTKLELEVSHPKLPGESKIFDISYLLHEGYRASPSTVRQIVDPSFASESRADALRTLLVDICHVRGNFPPDRREVPIAPCGDDIIDELEPTFEIRGQLLTELGDVVRGYSRRAVTVVRNHKPLVQFLLIEQEGAIRHGSMLLHPSHIEWPLLDRNGRYVTDQTVDATLHDFTHQLRQARQAPLLRVMESLGREVEDRVAQNEDASEALKRRAFVQEAWMACRDDRVWTPDFGKPLLSPMLAPPGYGYTPLELPDGRAFWIYHDIQGSGDVIRIAGYSLSGSLFLVQFHYPSNMSWRVGMLCERIESSGGWPDFSPALDVLRSSKNSAISLHYSPGADQYPAAVNALLDMTRGCEGNRNIGRGLWSEEDGRMGCYFADMVTEFVKGRLPIYGSVGGRNPASSWVFHAMLDGDLNGSVLFVNSLRGSLTMRSVLGFDVESRRRVLLDVLNSMYDSPGAFIGKFYGMNSFQVTSHNIPHRGEEELLGSLNAIAVSMWKGVKAAGHYFSIELCGHAPWRSQRLTSGEWALSLESVHSVKGALPYLLTCIVQEGRVREMFVSYGERGLFGGLFGKQIVPNEGSGFFSEHEVGAIVRTLSDRSPDARRLSVKDRVLAICPHADVSWISSLRRFDPEFKQRDLVSRIVRWFKNIW